MKANRSSAVVNDRKAPRDGLDDFPTPPWATRALIEHVIFPHLRSSGRTMHPERFLHGVDCLEPACGRGFMAAVLREYFGGVSGYGDHTVIASDILDYGYAPALVRDFLTGGNDDGYVDWVITNPPFTKAEAFIERAFEVASTGVAMLVRANFLEGAGRYDRLFSKRPPTIIAHFVERVSMVPGKVDPRANLATAYVWLVWTAAPPQPVVWIPPCRTALTRADDHIPPAERRR